MLFADVDVLSSVCKYQMLMEVHLGKPVYTVDTAQNGRLLAVGGAGSKMHLNVVS